MYEKTKTLEGFTNSLNFCLSKLLRGFFYMLQHFLWLKPEVIHSVSLLDTLVSVIFVFALAISYFVSPEDAKPPVS
jgi:hypothetical protein